MLSISCKYALRSVVYLMVRSKERVRCSIKEISAEIEANEHTTAKILQQLVKAEIIHSAKGPTGGFFMPASARPIPLIEVVKVVDGTNFFFECGLGLKSCSEEKPCPLHHHYKAARQALYQQFSTHTVQDLSENLSLGKSFLKR
ncbi:Rrf2 family transcriptional regulator [Paraflavisolibacter sp. H34]|uniref:RrF2 family transcriptional regulator n=1 Tax=Huijunlia imazamoxiresistens TaxID=3127457 RepID=UPI0030174D25